MKQVCQPPHQLGRLECSDACLPALGGKSDHPGIMAAESMGVLPLVIRAGAFWALLGTPARGCPDFMFQVGKQA